MMRVDSDATSFREFRERDLRYIDKTLLIKDLLDTNDRGVYLFTRPSGFGKTVNISMLDAFFNIEYRGNVWFDGLGISEYPEYQRYMNAFPVVRLDLSGLTSDSYGSFIDSLREAVKESYEHHRYLLDSLKPVVRMKRIFESLDEGSTSEASLKTAMEWLSLGLTNEFGVKPVILIDGYDSILWNHLEDASRDEILDCLGGFLHSALKANRSRGLAFVTGIAPICLANEFSGLNNVSIHSIFSEPGDECFGFTESEVETLLRDSGVSERMEEARMLYGGYRIGERTMFCPRDIMSYASNGFEPERRPIGTESVVSKLLRDADEECFEILAGLLAGQSMAADIDGVVESDRLEENGMFDLMVHSGLLGAIPLKNGRCEIFVPNEGSRLMIKELVSAITQPTGSPRTLPRGPWSTSTSSDSDRGP